MPTEAHYSRWVSDQAIEFLEQERKEEAPFFLWVNFFDPHHPFVAPQEYLARYSPSDLPDPVGYHGELSSKPSIQQEASRESYAGFARGFTSYNRHEIQQIVASYYSMVSFSSGAQPSASSWCTSSFCASGSWLMHPPHLDVRSRLLHLFSSRTTMPLPLGARRSRE